MEAVLRFAQALAQIFIEGELGTVLGKLNVLGFVLLLALAVVHSLQVEIFNRFMDIFDWAVQKTFRSQPLVQAKNERASFLTLFGIACLGMVLCLAVIARRYG